MKFKDHGKREELTQLQLALREKKLRQEKIERQKQIERQKLQRFEDSVKKQVDFLVHQTLTKHASSFRNEPDGFFQAVVDDTKSRLNEHAKAMEAKGKIRSFTFEVDDKKGTFYCCPERRPQPKIIRLNHEKPLLPIRKARELREAVG